MSTCAHPTERLTELAGDEWYCSGCQTALAARPSPVAPPARVSRSGNGNKPTFNPVPAPVPAAEASAHLLTPRDKVNEQTKLALLWAKDLEPLEESETESLWGPFIFPGSNVLVSGDSGVGKTTLLYNWAVHAARGEEFRRYSLPPPPTRALHRLRDA